MAQKNWTTDNFPFCHYKTLTAGMFTKFPGTFYSDYFTNTEIYPQYGLQNKHTRTLVISSDKHLHTAKMWQHYFMVI